MIITYYYVDYYVIITSLLRTIIVIMSPLLRIITVIMSPLLRVITVIMSPLLRIITRSIIRNNGLIITYYGPEQLADELWIQWMRRASGDLEEGQERSAYPPSAQQDAVTPLRDRGVTHLPWQPDLF